MTHQRLTRLTVTTAICGLALLTPLLVGAAPVDTSQWQCEFCPFEDGEMVAEVEAGNIYVDDAAAKFGLYGDRKSVV